MLEHQHDPKYFDLTFANNQRAFAIYKEVLNSLERRNVIIKLRSDARGELITRSLTSYVGYEGVNFK